MLSYYQPFLVRHQTCNYSITTINAFLISYQSTALYSSLKDQQKDQQRYSWWPFPIDLMDTLNLARPCSNLFTFLILYLLTGWFSMYYDLPSIYVFFKSLMVKKLQINKYTIHALIIIRPSKNILVTVQSGQHSISHKLMTGNACIC